MTGVAYYDIQHILLTKGRGSPPQILAKDNGRYEVCPSVGNNVRRPPATHHSQVLSAATGSGCVTKKEPPPPPPRGVKATRTTSGPATTTAAPSQISATASPHRVPTSAPPLMRGAVGSEDVNHRGHFGGHGRIGGGSGGGSSDLFDDDDDAFFSSPRAGNEKNCGNRGGHLRKLMQ